jgi:sugar fermentation stimulation protein A
LRPYGGPLEEGVLIRRYKRFLADVQMPNGQMRTIHVANPGAMTGMAEPGSAILMSRSENPHRKLPWSWELVRCGRTWACVNTVVANRVVGWWLRSGRLFPGQGAIRAEPRRDRTRFDFLVGDDLWIEVKSVTLAHGAIGSFPDSVSVRATRHLRELAEMRNARRVLLYFVARADVHEVRPAEDIDPAYAQALRDAAASGVEIRAVGARFDRRGAHWRGDLAVRLHSG